MKYEPNVLRFGCFTKVMNDAMIVGIIDHLMKKDKERNIGNATAVADDGIQITE